MISTAATLTIRGVVPVTCDAEKSRIEGRPVCNLELKQFNAITWIDYERGYIVTLDRGVITVTKFEGFPE